MSLTAGSFVWRDKDLVWLDQIQGDKAIIFKYKKPEEDERVAELVNKPITVNLSELKPT